ncbi:MAG: LPXTG cell wall anchor domain-containing protein [Oscillospiraceae bacterium]|nr:LPXTG cell wall anchor domain-containing protein [Oscillospiraceae bacterium]
MKNVFKKTVALVSAMSLMAVGTAVSVSASAEKFELEIKGSGDCVEAKEQIAGYNTYEVQPGATINADLTFIDSASKQFDTVSFRAVIGDLEFVKALPKGKLAQAAPDGTFVQYMESFGEPYVIEEAEEVIVTFQLKVPDTAKPGDQFKVEWAPEGDYEFNLVDSTVSEDDMAHSSVPAIFVVPGAVTTTEAPITTTEASLTTTEANLTTTEATITTTEAPATTVAATTVTTAGTTVSVSKAPSSPATGSSSNGVAALAVTMVAAAGAAIALKKKND